MDFSNPTLPSVATRFPALRSRASCRGFAVHDERVVVFESHLELCVLLLLASMPEVQQIIDQPPPVKYIDDNGEVKRHTFDFLVVIKNLIRILIAVRPVARLAKSGLPRTVELISDQLPPGIADRIIIITDADLTYADRYNALQAFECGRFPIVKHDNAILALTEDMLGSVKIADLVESAGLGGAGFRAVIRVITRGALMPVLPRRRITPDSYIIRTGRKTIAPAAGKDRADLEMVAEP